MNKILCIVGPTGTGKTALAVELTKQFPSILISADSRQVYKGMDIVTGKDHPKDIKIVGIDLVDPGEECSVAVWHDAVMPHIQAAWSQAKLPIIVGGTGLYVKALTHGIATMDVPINQSLRDQLSAFSLIELQKKLLELDNNKYLSMNNSDQNNPRRLIRAIEIAKSNLQGYKMNQNQNPEIDCKIIGIVPPPISKYEKIVRARVKSRIKEGAVIETQNIVNEYGRGIKSLSAIGYSSLLSFINNEISQEELIEKWTGGELSYAKRQLTWFRKQPVEWYDQSSNLNWSNILCQHIT